LRGLYIQLIGTILIASSLAPSAPPPAHGQGTDDVQTLNSQVVKLFNQGQYAKAAALAERTLSLARRGLGIEHPATLLSISNLAFGYQAQGRYSEAEPLYRQALRTSERVLGREHPDTLTIINN
jgi:tetratricopeptide (TPR) repeat protein